MKYLITIITVLIFNMSEAQENYMDSVSYSLGVMVAQNLKQQGVKNINKESFVQAFEDVLEDNELKIDPQSASDVVNQFFVKQEESKFAMNKEAGEMFLSKNKERPEVITTESGLQYEILSRGEGTKPTLSDKVKVHYHGTLTNGDVFDSSVQRGEPISFPLNGVIKGWQEGVQLMNVGSKYKFYIPYDLAYGANAAGAKIKPFSALVFEVELLGIE